MREKTQERWGKTNIGSVVEDYGVEWHGKEEKRVGWQRSHTGKI